MNTFLDSISNSLGFSRQNTSKVAPLSIATYDDLVQLMTAKTKVKIVEINNPDVLSKKESSIAEFVSDSNNQSLTIVSVVEPVMSIHENKLYSEITFKNGDNEYPFYYQIMNGGYVAICTPGKGGNCNSSVQRYKLVYAESGGGRRPRTKRGRKTTRRKSSKRAPRKTRRNKK